MRYTILVRIVIPALVASITLWTAVNCCSTITKSGSCKPDWFGSRCQYKCRCENNACISRYNGTCRAGNKCQGGWFGPECQYVDLAYNTTKVVTDGNDATCLAGYTPSLNVPLNITRFQRLYLFTWMRVLISEPWSERFLTNFKVEGLNENGTLQCSRARNYTVDQKTLDVYCEIPERISSVKLYGQAVSCLCSVHVSGGRNVAVGQATSQTGSSTNPRVKQECQSEDCFKSSCAVDGDTSDITRDSCTYIESVGIEPKWIINFTTPVQIIRKKIYNYYKKNNAVETLQNYTMVDLNERHNLLSTHDWKEINKFRSHDLYYNSIKHSVSSSVLKPYVNKNGTFKMSVCEIEIYGDYDCSKGWYGKECKERCQCADNEQCFVSTGFCLTGCAEGYQGKTCNSVCGKDEYGRNCKSQCSVNCIRITNTTSSCSPISGQCYQGCQDGYRGNKCDSVCNRGFYGKDCASLCNQNCLDTSLTTSACNHINGHCMTGCKDGFIGDKCDKTCEPGLYGTGCAFLCSENCRLMSGQTVTCNNSNGHCLIGCKDGYTGERCQYGCETGKYGRDCSFSCSDFCLAANNVDDTSCNHITGNCLFGCLPGYLLPHCVVKHTANKEDHTATFTAAVAVSGLAIILLFVLISVAYRKIKRNDSSANSDISMKNIPITKMYTKKVDSIAVNYNEKDEEAPGLASDDTGQQTAVENVYSNCECTG